MNTERTTQAAAAVPHHGMQRVLQQNLIVLFLVERGGPENRPEYILLLKYTQYSTARNERIRHRRIAKNAVHLDVLLFASLSCNYVAHRSLPITNAANAVSYITVIRLDYFFTSFLYITTWIFGPFTSA